ncbi:uncharacterized protein LOC131061694 isoform X1 [Cryptomeria japonica]|uniref:uncharacterized protein LOC131061694 isoform X1 n=1 Tax=Cryptomeria japonica TaxID=3369 RepID=UPI0027DA09B5|nr:uncharacterized protein LOC131061694 isoform X1 [Cryptomeria japonica]
MSRSKFGTINKFMPFPFLKVYLFFLSKKRLIANNWRKLRNYCSFAPNFSTTSSASNYSLLWGDNSLQMAGMETAISRLKYVRAVVFVLGVLCVLSAGLAVLICSECSGDLVIPAAIIAVSAGVRIVWMFGSGYAQAITASTILREQTDNFVVDNAVRHERRMAYKRWLWWSRFGVLVTLMLVVGASYLVIIIIKSIHGHDSSDCYPGQGGHGGVWKQILVVALAIVAWVLVIAQCCAGSDVLAWRSFYARHDGAWKTHYREMFDHGIREVLCCLGRAQYLSILEADEVDSVAGLLGDLVAYRAAGAGHLEFLAGVALLQRQQTTLPPLEQFAEAPVDQLQEAVVLHPFAEAAYTGPLLDVGRNPILFPCAWLYRQGVLTPWSRNRRPILEGDNWCRGHAAAFLKYVNLSPDALRKGRVHQARREAAYFVVVVHHLQCVVIAVRGTETPEDLLTDGLCRECMLSEKDLHGLLNSNVVEGNVKQHVTASFPHFGHAGIVEAARELCMQLDGNIENEEQISLVHEGSQDVLHHPKRGILSSLLGDGGECQGYALRFVGHSLGGAVGTLAGIMMYGRYPNMHVYAYGVLPCVDAVIADACSGFVTSIIYNDEFSSRLSITSILRLRAAALAALAADSSTDSAIISKLTRRLLRANKYLQGKNNEEVSVQISQSSSVIQKNKNQKRRRIKHTIKGGVFLCNHATSCITNMTKLSSTRPVRNPVKCKLHASVKGDLLNDEKHRDVIIDAAEIEESLSFGSIRHKHTSISDMQTSALPAGAESRDNASFEERSVLIQDSDAEKPGNDEDEGRHKETNNNDFCVHSSESTITQTAMSGNTISEPMDTNLEIDATEREPVEMYVPGLVIHIVPEAKENTWPSWRNWKWHRGEDHSHRAILRHRDSFKDIVVSPSMFLDHMPWRVHYAMQKVLETWNSRDCRNNDMLDSSELV